MSLPPGFLDELRTRLSLSAVVGRRVMWDARKSNQSKGDMWAPCPFHQEKTASFHVDDRKGFYYCFGCHAKGDAIAFVRETENVGFIEAVEILAGEAGMQMPARDPKAAEAADRHAALREVVEMAQRWFRMQLGTAAGSEARAYLGRRGLDAEAQERWEIGLAPPGWQGLGDHLRGKGVSDDDLIAAGLVRKSDRGGAPYDVFRHRIVFPIRDARGRAIAFGGRALDPGDNAKYLNSPETPIFDKGRCLYNHAAARSQDGPLIVAEGYMDVIALGEAGLRAVAPLGTAITEAQLQLLWQIEDEPVVALDGDAAGQRAAHRLLDLALPLLAPGRSLSFAMMPPGRDPDDVLRGGGRAAMDRLIAGAIPLVEMLWRRETGGRDPGAPERRAALDATLRAALGRIGDASVRRHYGEAIRERRWQLFNPRTHGRRAPSRGATAETRASTLASGGARIDEGLRELTILALLVRFPALIADFADRLTETEFTATDRAGIAACLLRQDAPADRARIEEELGPAALETLANARHLGVVPALRSDEPGAAARCLELELATLAALRGAERELDEALEDLDARTDEGLTWRLNEANAARERALRSGMEASGEFDMADNGVRLDRAERDALDTLLRRIGSVAARDEPN